MGQSKCYMPENRDRSLRKSVTLFYYYSINGICSAGSRADSRYSMLICEIKNKLKTSTDVSGRAFL